MLLMDREELTKSLEKYQYQIEAKEAENLAQKLKAKIDLDAQINYKHQQKENQKKMEAQERAHEELIRATHNQKHWTLAMDKLNL